MEWHGIINSISFISYSLYTFCFVGPRAFYPSAYKVGNEMEKRDPIEIKIRTSSCWLER